MVVAVLPRWQGGCAALIVTVLTGVLVILDINDRAMRRWWDGHALTTDTVSGLLVLLITLLVVDQGWSGFGSSSRWPAPWRRRRPSS